jgi:hypothetical protein
LKQKSCFYIHRLLVVCPLKLQKHNLVSSLLLLWGLPSEVLMSLAQGHHFDDARSFVLSKQRDVMVMDQNDMMPLSMPELLEKFAGHAEPLLGQLGLKKGIYMQIRHLHTSLSFSTTLLVFLAKCWIPKS